MNKHNTWQLQEAKSKFSQLVDNAMHSEPQFVTKHGYKAVVVISIEDYEKFLKPESNIVDFLRSSPLAKAEIEINRDSDYPRDIVL